MRCVGSELSGGWRDRTEYINPNLSLERLGMIIVFLFYKSSIYQTTEHKLSSNNAKTNAKMQMKITLLFLTTLLTSVLASPAPADLQFRALCKAPKCTAYCEDGTIYDCCVDYIRDPCWGHYLGDAQK
ncbi:hypothetical protein BKA64DRAFT_661316 [Cadophora sp. MPI-SDFR-AT-0126]|nr:hypothetical protein BKA64DRAFT_661316 [Leotiomycetes sp. MPI-SDFR-AT-0126]